MPLCAVHSAHAPQYIGGFSYVVLSALVAYTEGRGTGTGVGWGHYMDISRMTVKKL